MTVLFDTARLPEHERVDALQAAFTVESPQVVDLLNPRVRHRTEVVELGPGLRVRRDEGSPLAVARNARHVRIDAPEVLAIAFQRQGDSMISVGEHERVLRAGDLQCTDTTRPYRYVQHTAACNDVVMISAARAGVSIDTARAAAPRLPSSPVFELVRAHVAGLFDATTDLPPQPRAVTGQATAALIRTLLLTAAGVDGAPDALHDVLGARIADYIESHLADPELDVERIAAAHHISVRHLYTVWARAGHEGTPAQWIIGRRLERARDLLVDPGEGRLGVTAVARRCGFADSSHFSRRFRQAFGVSPREWRATGGSFRAVA